MIHINLLPPEYEEAQSQKEQKILLGSTACLTMAVLGLFLLVKKRQAATLKEDIKGVQAELDKYQTIVAQINQIQSDKQRLTEKRDIIRNLNRSRLIYPVLFDDLLPIIPPDVWVSNMQFEEQGGPIRITMDTFALSNFALATWLTNIKQSIHFSNVTLSGSVSYTKTADQSQVLSFKTICTYQHQGPFPLSDSY